MRTKYLVFIKVRELKTEHIELPSGAVPRWKEQVVLVVVVGCTRSYRNSPPSRIIIIIIIISFALSNFDFNFLPRRSCPRHLAAPTMSGSNPFRHRDPGAETIGRSSSFRAGGDHHDYDYHDGDGGGGDDTTVSSRLDDGMSIIRPGLPIDTYLLIYVYIL